MLDMDCRSEEASSMRAHSIALLCNESHMRAHQLTGLFLPHMDA